MRLQARERDPVIAAMYGERWAATEEAFRHYLGLMAQEGNGMAGKSDLINAGGLKEHTFKSGNNGFTFYLFAEEVEKLLQDFPGAKYISGIAVENTKDKGPSYYLSFFPDQGDDWGRGRDGSRDGGRNRDEGDERSSVGRDGGRDRGRDREERDDSRNEAKDPFEDKRESRSGQGTSERGTSRGTASGNRRSSRFGGGRGRR